tara:strand:- start:3712 stop:5106 length:1395 start_codon:yes stop_codon:yes gene_type:complete
MTAIITDKIKRTFLTQIFDEATGSKIGDSDNYYYIAVGRSQSWDPVAQTDNAPTPNVSEREERLFRYNLSAVKAIEAFSFVVPIKEWLANAQYAQYNDNVAGQPAISYYVRTADNNIYICIRSGKDSQGNVQVSTVKPSHTNAQLNQELDGYIWKYLYTISTQDTNFFVTSNFMPVKFVDSAAATDPYFSQFTIQNAAVQGQIVGYRVVNGGSGYDSSTTTISIVGDGSGATAYPIVGSGAITAIEVGDSSGRTNIGNFLGSGYDRANVVIGSPTGTNAEVVPVFGPKQGLGKDPREDLRSTSMMFHIKPEGAVSQAGEKTWVVGNDYRQVALWKNPKDSAGGGLFTGTAGSALRKVKMTDKIPSTVAYANDIELTGDSNAKGWIDYIQDSAVWYHQDEVTGFTPFRVGEPVNIENFGTGLTINEHDIKPDVDRYSGELFFINNADAQPRTVESTDDIKLVIQL